MMFLSVGIGANLPGRWCRDANVDAEVAVGREKVSTREYERMRRDLAKVRTERDIRPTEVPVSMGETSDLT